jgi:phytoene dehydrogenase-like protein
VDGRDPSVCLGNAVQVSPSIAYLQRAFDCTKYGEYSDRPYLDLRIPTLADPDLAPPGSQVMSITIKYAPYHLRGGNGSTGDPAVLWAARREALVETVLATLAEYAPDIREKVAGFRLLTPVDLEQDYGLPEGNLNHGEMTLDQFFHMRPIPGWANYRTPVAGLYLCGSGSHPGGGVTGLPGRNAARVINLAKGWLKHVIEITGGFALPHRHFARRRLSYGHLRETTKEGADDEQPNLPRDRRKPEPPDA